MIWIQIIQEMQHLESSYLSISFASREDEEDGFYALLMKKVPIKSAGMHRYVINRESLQILDRLGLKYKIEENK